MISPLKFLESKRVKAFLKDFYSQNFTLSSVPSEYARQIIDFAWLAANGKITEDFAKSEINKIFSKANKNLIYSEIREVDQIDLVNFDNVKTFLDFGTNKLDYLNKVAILHPHIQKLYAADVIPQARPFIDSKRSQYIQVNPSHKNLGFPNNLTFDQINFKFILHHLLSAEDLNKVLDFAHQRLNSKGRVVVWEETFEECPNINKLVMQNNKLGIFTDPKLSKMFYDLDEKEKLSVIIVNDWLINTNNEHMQWSGLYKSSDDWVKVFKNNGFSLVKLQNLGIRINGRLKQGIHIIYEFKKDE